MNYREKSLEQHYKWKGKIETVNRVPISSKDELCIAYTPGVSEPCLEISKDVNKSFELTRRWNTVAVITDGTAILGLGDIGPEAGMPVMEGKCSLFKAFGDVDAFPICLKTKDTEEIVKTIKIISGSFGGINLEDISAPRCFEIETRLKEELDIPVFHDDQHGTAIVVGSAMLNALKLANKNISEVKVVLNGAGAAGIAISKYLLDLGVKHLTVCDKAGIIVDNDERFNHAQQELAKKINPQNITGTLADAMVNADVFVGVSAGNIVSKEMVRSMNEKAILFPMANPTPEISYQDAIDAGAFIVGTGSSQNPNQINNALVFPGLFRGVLDAKACKVTKEMMIAATYAIKDYVSSEELCPTHILPYAWDKLAHQRVSEEVMKKALETDVLKRK